MATDLLKMLQTEGSPLSYGNGETPTINPLATQQSKMHADNTNPGYSLNGSNFSDVNNDWQQYNDGMLNNLPIPSLLDRDGLTPPTYKDTGPIDGHY